MNRRVYRAAHRRTHRHDVLEHGVVLAVVCSPRRCARWFGAVRTFHVRVGDADWVELTRDQFVSYAFREDLAPGEPS